MAETGCRSPISVFSESTAAMDCELWKSFSAFAYPSRVLHVHSQKDVTTLRKAVGHWRLVVVHVPRLLATVAWTVMLHGSGTSSRPTIFSRAVPSTVDDVSIPILVIVSVMASAAAVNGLAYNLEMYQPSIWLNHGSARIMVTREAAGMIQL